MLTALLFGAPWVPSARQAFAATQPQAIVLDPFPTQHSPGYDGQDVVTHLQDAGFTVTYLAGSQVTVQVMKQLGRYAVVYIYTHAGPLPNNDAAVSTGETRRKRYASYFANYSLVKMHIMSDKGYRYFNAVTGGFIRRYSGKFSPHSLIFLNACTALGMPKFWRNLKAAGVGTLISWRYHVSTVDADRSAHEFFSAFAQGQTVDQAMRTVAAKGAATSVFKDKIGRFEFIGQGKTTADLVKASATT